MKREKNEIKNYLVGKITFNHLTFDVVAVGLPSFLDPLAKLLPAVPNNVGYIYIYIINLQY